MAEAPDYVFQEWLKDAHDQGPKEQRAHMIYLLERIVELLEEQGKVRPG